MEFKKTVSLYIRVKETILSRIQEKVWPPNLMIPTEYELMEEFGVSRTTIRQAIALLVQEGILEKKQGRGTVVKPQLLTGNLGKLKGFAEEAREKGIVPSSKVIVVKPGKDLNHEKSMLNVPPDEEIVVIERLRFANDTPVAIERSCWPYTIGKLIMDHDLNEAKFYEILEDNEIFLKHAVETITAVNATVAEADLLGIRGGKALLRMERLSFGEEKRPIEYTATKFCGDHYHYHLELMKETGSL